jgi:hypothetical protein
MIRVSFELELEVVNFYEAQAEALSLAATFFNVDVEEISERVATELKVKSLKEDGRFVVLAHIQLKNSVTTMKA